MLSSTIDDGLVTLLVVRGIMSCLRGVVVLTSVRNIVGFCPKLVPTLLTFYLISGNF